MHQAHVRRLLEGLQLAGFLHFSYVKQNNRLILIGLLPTPLQDHGGCNAVLKIQSRLCIIHHIS